MNFKRTLAYAVFAVSALAATTSSASVTTFDYSYKFGDSQMIDGTFTGTASGNLITSIGNITGQITGTGANSGYLFHDLLPGSYSPSTAYVSFSGAVVSFDGLASNFFFTSSDQANWFYAIPSGSGQTLEQARLDGNVFIDHDNRFYNPANFSVVAEQVADPSGVPEPATVALLGLGLLGFVASRRKAAKSTNA